uniref:PKS_AT domain-containing protein n=2 Tax=Caenorhabditis tropicalis TaxID=1561998 RepID=A0A1I7TG03_9PELO
MLSPFRFMQRSTRLIRRKSTSEPKILDEGATFSDVHNVILNPTTRLPYPEKLLRSHIEKTTSEILKERNRIKLEQTLFCQPAVVTSSVAAFEALKVSDMSIEENLTDTAGFSVGEYSALVAGKVLSFGDAIRIVKARAEAMTECAKLVNSGMVTIRVNGASKLDKAILDARKSALENCELDICEIANYLYCGVRVIGGSERCLKYLEENQQKYSIQVLKRLAVSAAFHTRLMEAAVEKVAHAFKNIEMHPPVCNVHSNYTGKVMSSKKSDIRGAVAKQVASPVRWEQIQQVLFRKHTKEVFPRFYEIGPGRQLGAMLFQTSKKAYKNYTHFSC